jgi:hypothetical protein
MIKITFEDLTVDLIDTQLSIVRTSPYPLIATGSQAGNFIFNFNLPATPELKRKFNFANRPQSANPFIEVPYRIDGDAGLVFEGTALVQEASDEFYEVSCTVGNGDFNAQAKKIKLNEIDLGGARQLNQPVFTHANLTDSISYYSVVSSDPFEETIIPEFSVINLNIGNHLNIAGTQYSIDATSNITMTIYFKASIVYGLFAFRVFLNNVLHEEFIITGDQIETIVFPAQENMVITWKLFVQNESGVNPDTFDLDGIIYNTTEIHFSDNASLVDPAPRYPDVDFAIFPLEDPLVFANWDDDFYQVDNTNIKVLYQEFFKVINYFKESQFPYMLSGQVDGNNLTAGNLITPFPYIAYLIKRIAYHFNYKVDNNIFEDELKYTVLINLFFENEFLTDNTKILAAKTGFDLKDHVPDWTIYEFFNHLNNLFGFGYEVDVQKRTITFNFLEEIMKDVTFIDISHLVISKKVDNQKPVTGIKLTHKVPSADKAFEGVKSLYGLTLKGTINTYFELPVNAVLNDCYFITMLDSYYAWIYNPELYKFAWTLYSKNFIQFVSTGVEEKEISTDLCPVLLKSPNQNDDVLGHPDGRQWLIPASHQPGRFEGAPDMFQTQWTPMIAYYHGMLPDWQNINYPFASSDNRDAHGNVIPGMSLSLRLDGENGLFAKKWKRYIDWRITARSVKVKILPDIKFLRSLNFSKKLVINGVHYLLVEYRGNIDKNGPKEAELTLLVL